jgi:CsoR family transcriptional regulator, copper-sensing transcriptional repressor
MLLIYQIIYPLWYIGPNLTSSPQLHTIGGMYKNKDKEKLIHRLNRVSGQIEGLKKSLSEESEEDCLKTLQQLKASINALKKFGEAYIQNHMHVCLKTSAKSTKDMESMLSDIISGAFSL